MIVVGRVVENALLEIVAGTVKGMLVFVIAEIAAAVLLVDGVENMEELADATELVVGRFRVELGESGFDETRLRREVAREADSAHAAAVGAKREIGGKAIDWFLVGEVEIIVEMEKLFVERWVIGEDADGIVVDFETVCD